MGCPEGAVYVCDKLIPEISANRTIGSRVSMIVSFVLIPSTGHRNLVVAVDAVAAFVSAAKITTTSTTTTTSSIFFFHYHYPVLFRN
jgi:hypothetical protein